MKPKKRIPFVKVRVLQLRHFAEVAGVSTAQDIADLVGVSLPYMRSQLRQSNDTELNDVVGCQLLGYFAKYGNLFDTKLVQRMIFELLRDNGYLKPMSKILTFEKFNFNKHVSGYGKASFSSLKNVTFDTILTAEQIKTLCYLTGFSIIEFTRLYSTGTINPVEGGMINQSIRYIFYDKKSLTLDKQIRIWIALLHYYKFIDLNDLQRYVDEFNSRLHYAEFESLRQYLRESKI